MSALFTPLTIRETVFQNRVWVSPMCQYQATNGHIGPWHKAHLGAFATGAPGLIMVEATGVIPEGRRLPVLFDNAASFRIPLT